MESLRLTDDQSAAVAVAPRVTLDGMMSKIACEYFVTGAQAVGVAPAHGSLEVLTLCIIVMQNGFTVIGKAAPASPDNFNVDLGRKFAREDAIRQLWPLEGYALREALAKGGA